MHVAVRFLSNISQLANRLQETKFSSRLPATANICNVVLMRNHELFTGIEVKDKEGNVVGTSKIAARKVHIYGREVNMARYWPRSFMVCLWTKTESSSINTHTKWTRPISSHIDRTSLVNTGFIRRFLFKRNFSFCLSEMFRLYLGFGRLFLCMENLRCIVKQKLQLF